MSFIADHQRKFTDLDYQINNLDQLRRQANGGNSILFGYPPKEENLYLAKATEALGGRADFIDVSRLLVSFIDGMGWGDFERYYREFGATPHKVFRAGGDDPDLFNTIIAAIVASAEVGKIPILIRTGCLVGTGIENANIMDCKEVMRLKVPLVIFYPSVIVDENLLFLNFKPASKYRCTLVY